MLRKIYLKKILISVSALFALFLIYLIPTGNKELKNINSEVTYIDTGVETNNIYLLDSHNMVSLTSIMVSGSDIETKAKDLIEWTDGKALVGTGIPAADVEYNGVTYQIGQANNALMYPGLGLGLIASTATRVNAEIISQASRALGGIVDVTKPGAAILPPVAKITEFSQTIAETVAKSVVAQNLNREEITDIKEAVESAKWVPEYKSLED